MERWGTNLEHTLAAAVKLHAEADAAGLTGAGELTEQGGEDGAGQCLLRTESCVIAQVKCYTKSNTEVKEDYRSEEGVWMCFQGETGTLSKFNTTHLIQESSECVSDTLEK